MSTNPDSGPSASDEPPALQAGARIGRYLILERVGSGSMGVVYGAYDPELDRRIALKLLNGDGGELQATAHARLLREAKAMARLAHPNVIAVHDVGVFEERVFLAMEFLGGGTLRSWLAARPRGWREVLEVFVAAGRGLLAAHAAGLVHRDFKLENVLLDREGRPRVVDFGLARETGSGDGGASAALAALAAGVPAAANPLSTVTTAGAIMGTPAYMAPEQFLGEPTDARTDQFSFCVALYEALYGERPYEGDSLQRLLHNVTGGQLRPAPADRDVPAWVRRAVLHGLANDPYRRWPSMTQLIEALGDDPAVRQRRIVVTGAVTGLVVACMLAVGLTVRHRLAELERRVAPRLEEAAQAATEGRAQAAALRALRQRAFEAFDSPDRARGEALWKQAQAAIPGAEAAYEHAEQAYEAVMLLDPARDKARDRLAEVLAEHLALDEELRRHERARALATRLERWDEQRGQPARARAAPGLVTLRTRPAATAVSLEHYQRDPDGGRRRAQPAPPLAAGGSPATLLSGSYRLRVQAPGRAEVLFPFEVRRGQRVDIDLALPPAAAVPRGFAYVPPGELWFGDADEALRTGFLDTVPIHRRSTGAFLIARHEVTYADWIAFLDSLPEAERSQHSPNVSVALRGSLRLREIEGGGWQIAFQPMSQRYVATQGQPLVYRGRQARAQLDWSRLPVGGVSPADARRYLAWLRASGGVPGARMCTELEWERAARGADDRVFPHGDELLPEDANFDQTYGRVDSAFGPDEVGSHPASRSPFGVDDLTGNLFELVQSSLKAGETAIRGGAYYFSSHTCRATNREVVPPTFHDVTTGLRVCASISEPVGGGRVVSDVSP